MTGESRLLSFLGLRRGDGRSLQSVFYVYLLAFDLLKLPSGRKFALKLQTKTGRVSATPATSSIEEGMGVRCKVFLSLFMSVRFVEITEWPKVRFKAPNKKR